MNERGQYGTSRVGQLSYWATPTSQKQKEAEEQVVKEHPARTGAILLVALGTIGVIGVVGAKRGVKFM